MTLVLLDIDGTLIRSGGAGREALDCAFGEVLGVPNMMEGISLAGATDGWILDQVEAKWGPFDRTAIQAAYLHHAARLMASPGRVYALPGVLRAVTSMEERAVVGLTTGNWRQGARIKLCPVGLERLLDRPGAFGDDAHDRTALVPFAVKRAREAGYSPEKVIVVGDTPQDVACARAGASVLPTVAVVVETGFASSEELIAARPDMILPDLDRGLGWLLATL